MADVTEGVQENNQSKKIADRPTGFCARGKILKVINYILWLILSLCCNLFVNTKQIYSLFIIHTVKDVDTAWDLVLNLLIRTILSYHLQLRRHSVHGFILIWNNYSIITTIRGVTSSCHVNCLFSSMLFFLVQKTCLHLFQHGSTYQEL